jgi:hypothetical protein
MIRFRLIAHAARLAFPVAAFAFGLMPVSVSGQAPIAARDEVVWHWFGACAGSDSLAFNVSLDGKPVYSSTFPICRQRRADIKPDRQQRLLQFRFAGVPRRFVVRSRAAGVQLIEGNVWETGGERHAILLGVSLAAGDQVLMNLHLVASTDGASRSEGPRGFVITTRPVRVSRQK